MNIIKLKEILRETTVVLSKGETTEYHLQALEVPRVLCGVMPTIDDVGTSVCIVDCQFLAIGVHRNKAARAMSAFTQLLEEYPRKLELREGASYKHLIPVLGDEMAAFRFLALGHVLGLWSVLLPKDLGVTHAQDAAAALGWLYMTGYPRSVFLEDEAAVC